MRPLAHHALIVGILSRCHAQSYERYQTESASDVLQSTAASVLAAPQMGVGMTKLRAQVQQPRCNSTAAGANRNSSNVHLSAEEHKNALWRPRLSCRIP